MKVRNLTGEITNWKLLGNTIALDDTRPRSKLHIAARGIIHEIFTSAPILEEVAIHPRSFKTLYLDFYLPNIKLAVEVHGQQHYKYTAFFHASAQDFLNQKRNDADKKEWCEANSITLIELPYNEDEEKWKQRIIMRNH